MAEQGQPGADGAGNTGDASALAAAAAAGGDGKGAAGATGADGKPAADAKVEDKSALAGAGEKKDAEADAGKKDDGAKKDEGKATVVEPAYAKELVRPEGIPWSDDTWAAVAPVLAKHNVTKEAAQDLVNAMAGQSSKAIQAQQAADAAVLEARKVSRAECLSTFKPEEFQAARRAIERSPFADDPVLVQHMINVLGDNPAFIRGMAKFGQAIADDGTPGAAGSSGGAASVRTADKFYGKA